MRVILLAVVVGLLGPLAVAAAQETVPTQAVQQQKVPPPASPGDGHTESSGDRTKSDDTGVTGWGGSWSANEGSQTDDAETATTRQAKPLPAVPQAPVSEAPVR